jgi:hypothetical protein
MRKWSLFYLKLYFRGVKVEAIIYLKTQTDGFWISGYLWDLSNPHD